MRFPHVLLMIPLFLVLWCTTAMAGEDVLPDPTASLHPTDNIVALAKLRPLLAKSPDDQHLLGLALMCYVNLCLMGEAETDGGIGPWLGYADELMAKRVAARKGAAPKNLTDAAPELWLQVVRNNRVQVLTILADFANERDTPTYRALYAIASTDWRQIKDLKAPTLYERYAGLRLGFEVSPRSLMGMMRGNERMHNPSIVCEMGWRGNTWGDPPTIPREAITFTAWMLASSDLPDAQAISMLQELGAAVDAPIDPTIARTELWRGVHAACQRLRPAAKPLAVAIRICERLLDQPHGIIGADKSLALYGLGDLAAWNRDRLYMGAFFTYLTLRDREDGFQQTDKVMGAVLRELLPGSLIASRYSLGYQGQTFVENDKPDPAAWPAFAEAIAQEMDRPRPHGPGVLIISINKLAVGRPDLAAPLLRRLLAHLPGIPGRAHLDRLVDAAEFCGLVPLVLPALNQAHAQAPMDLELDKLWQRWSADTPLLALDGRRPLRSWSDQQIDNRRLPWPGLNLSQWFAIRWTGALRIDRPGTYVFAVESDDGSRLTVGDVVVDNRGGHAMQVRRNEAELVAGVFPLRLEYEQGRGEAGCRLLWQPPGAKQLELIPAANLMNANGRTPGLIADGFDQSKVDRDPPPTAADLAFVADRPWHLQGLERVAEAYFEAWMLQKAVPYYRTIRAHDRSSFYARRLHQCLLWSEPMQVDEALKLIEEAPNLSSTGWEIVTTTYALRNAGRLPDLVRIIGDRLKDDPVYPFALGYEALDRGDFVTAREHFGKLLIEGGAGDRYLPNPAVNFIRLHWIVLARFDGKEPKWEDLDRGLQRNSAQPFHNLIFDWLSGSVSWEDSAARIPEVEDGADLLYFRDLVALTTGDHATAKAGFTKLIAEHPTWIQAPTCRGLLKWYETQTAEGLAKVATANPIGATTPAKPGAPAKPGKPRPDANDF